jgi:hypothetical protein
VVSLRNSDSSYKFRPQVSIHREIMENSCFTLFCACSVKFLYTTRSHRASRLCSPIAHTAHRNPCWFGVLVLAVRPVREYPHRSYRSQAALASRQSCAVLDDIREFNWGGGEGTWVDGLHATEVVLGSSIELGLKWVSRDRKSLQSFTAGSLLVGLSGDWCESLCLKDDPPFKDLPPFEGRTVRIVGGLENEEHKEGWRTSYVTLMG